MTPGEGFNGARERGHTSRESSEPISESPREGFYLSPKCCITTRGLAGACDRPVSMEGALEESFSTANASAVNEAVHAACAKRMESRFIWREFADFGTAPKSRPTVLGSVEHLALFQLGAVTMDHYM